MSQTDPEPLKTPLVWLLAALIIVPLCARFPLLRVRGFNPDELEHLQASWLVAAGQLPYRDFFEHHTPALYYLLQPLFRVLDVEGSVTDAWSAIFWARAAMVFFSAAALALKWWFGRRWRGRTTAWASAFLLGNTALFLSKTLEIRPDVPALAFLLGALLCGSRGFTAAGARAASGWLGLAGALLSVALLFTQKVLFVLPGSRWPSSGEACRRSSRPLARARWPSRPRASRCPWPSPRPSSGARTRWAASWS